MTKTKWTLIILLCLAAALKSTNIKGQLKQIIQPSWQEFADLISSEIHKQLKPLKDQLKTQRQWNQSFKENNHGTNAKLHQLE